MRRIKPVQQSSQRKRTLLFGVVFFLLFSGLGMKSVYLQVFCSEWLAKKATDQYERSFPYSGKRGTIYDRNQKEMAVSIETKAVAAHPTNIKDPGGVATQLSRVLGLDYREVYESLSSKKAFVWIKRQISPKEEKELADLALDGVIFQTGNSRFYPFKALGGQILGFTGVDGNGLDGVEYSYDSYLKGKAVNLTVMKDALGRRFEADKEEVDKELSGNNLILTLDTHIQYIAEKALEEGVLAHEGKSGMALVMDPKTGAMLAMAHYPFFNPNQYKKYDNNKAVRRNRAITDPFEPGSTIKVFSAAAALDSGVCSASTTFFCENGNYRVGRNVIHDAANHSYGWLTLEDIIKYSSNIGAVKIKEAIGNEKLYNELTDFGFGRKTNVDLVGEAPGQLAHYNKWTPIDAGTISFGQGVSVSALQLVSGISAIANNGVLMRPHVVNEIYDAKDQKLKTLSAQPVRRVISEKTVVDLKTILKTVMTDEGTGTNGAVEGYTVCGKTGTAQKIGETGLYEPGKYVSSFVGFLPAENPVLTILVIVDEPEKQYYGGAVAAPIFKKIAYEVLYYLNIPPTPGMDKYRVARESEVRG
jgi:cell division protein FtsI (penicillin-binding protein 3)